MKSLPILLLLTATASADPNKLTLTGAIDLTMQRSPDLAAAQATVNSARARASGTSAKRLPSLNINAIGNLYTEPFSVMFPGFQGAFTLHKQVTSISNVQVLQPLTGLAYLSELVGAAEHDANAAAADYDKTRLDTAYRTAESFIRTLEGRAAADVAHRSVADIAAELDRAEKLRAADTLTNVDVLRLQSAKAQSDQQAVHADTAAQIGLSTLVVTIGLHDGDVIDIADDLPPDPPALALSLEQAIQRAVATRPELRAAREHIAAANDLVTSKKEEYLPNINANATWTHTTGLEPFQPANEEYVGLQLQWKVWDWGTIHNDIKEAESTQLRARIGASALSDQVRLEVRRNWLDAKANFENLASAKVQLQTAEEAYRLQSVKFENGAATTTDVLDAETEVARARLRSALARYDYYLSLLSLARSVGDVPNVAAATSASR